MKSKRSVQDNAFTLLEILIVSAIMIVIVAMLFPAIARTKSSAQRSACLANLRQIGVGFHGYLGENNYKIFPRGAQGDVSNYIAFIFPYASEKSFYRCPSTPTPASYTERTYKMNKTTVPDSGKSLYERSYLDIKNPAATILLFDRGDIGKRKLFVRDTVEWEYADDINTNGALVKNYPFNHAISNNAQNLLFLDGSARFEGYPLANDWYYPR